MKKQISVVLTILFFSCSNQNSNQIESSLTELELEDILRIEKSHFEIVDLIPFETTSENLMGNDLRIKKIRVFASLALLFTFSACQQNQFNQMKFPKDLDRINSELPARKINLGTTNKIVFYLDISKSSLFLFSGAILDWSEFAKEYPDIAVLIYLSGVDETGSRTKENMEKILRSSNFPYEVFLDPDYQLYELNSLDRFPYENKDLQTYYVKGNEILGISNFGIPNVRKEELDRYFGRD
jgi:hypothetical protein